MARLWTWLFRGTFLAVLALAFAGAVDADERVAMFRVGPDQVNHAVLAYALTLFCVASFRRAKPWIISLAVMSVGVSLELIQGAGWFAGDAQLGDLLADVVGVVAALLPLAVGRAQGRVNEGERLRPSLTAPGS
jgi:hypothetical protein